MLLGHGPALGLLVAVRPLSAGRDLRCAGTRARGGVLVSVSVLGTGVARTLGQDFFARVLDLPLFDFIWV